MHTGTGMKTNQITGQIDIFEWMESNAGPSKDVIPAKGNTDKEPDDVWHILNAGKHLWDFPKQGDRWQNLECRVRYTESGKEQILPYRYRDYHFEPLEDIPVYDADNGFIEIKAWRYVLKKKEALNK